MTATYYMVMTPWRVYLLSDLHLKAMQAHRVNQVLYDLYVFLPLQRTRAPFFLFLSSNLSYGPSHYTERWDAPAREK